MQDQASSARAVGEGTNTRVAPDCVTLLRESACCAAQARTGLTSALHLVRSLPMNSSASRASRAHCGLLKDRAVLDNENDEGAVEYKWCLADVSADRIRHLVTQMQFRISEGAGQCVYEIGVADNGVPLGLEDTAFDRSLETVRRMADELDVVADVVYERTVSTTPRRRCAEVRVRRLVDTCTINLVFMGECGAGKSTLTGVLSSDCLDDGNGRARQAVFVHADELRGDGSTLCPSRRSLTIARRRDGNGPPHHDKCTIIDLPGDKQRQTAMWSELLARRNAIVALVCSAVSPVSQRYCELVSNLKALAIDFFFVLTHSDAATTADQRSRMHEVHELVAKHAGISTKAVQSPVSPLRRTESTDMFMSLDDESEVNSDRAEVPLFFVSSLTGNGLSDLKSYVAMRTQAVRQRAEDGNSAPLADVVVRRLCRPDDMVVVLGCVVDGRVSVGDTLQLGPIDRCNPYLPVRVDSIQVDHEFTSMARCGDDAGFALSGPGADFLNGSGPALRVTRLRLVTQPLELAYEIEVACAGPPRACDLAALAVPTHLVCDGAVVPVNVIEANSDTSLLRVVRGMHVVVSPGRLALLTSPKSAMGVPVHVRLVKGLSAWSDDTDDAESPATRPGSQDSSSERP